MIFCSEWVGGGSIDEKVRDGLDGWYGWMELMDELNGLMEVSINK